LPVRGAVAAALGVRDLPAVEAAGALAGALARRQLLLVLDNCEHVIEAAAERAGPPEIHGGWHAHRYLCVIRELAARGLVALADKGYIGAGEHTCTLSTGDGTSPHPRNRRTALTPSYDPPASAPTPTSRTGTSCASSAAGPDPLDSIETWRTAPARAGGSPG
jgi:hypothetical protein